MLIQIEVKAQNYWIGRDFGEADIFTKCNKGRAWCNKRAKLASTRIINSVRKSK